MVTKWVKTQLIDKVLMNTYLFSNKKGISDPEYIYINKENIFSYEKQA